MKKIGNIILFYLFFFFSIPLYPKIIITGNIDHNYVIKGQTVRYTLTVEAQNESTKINSPDIRFPEVKGLKRISVYTSSSHSFSFINGKTITADILKTFYVLEVLPNSGPIIKIPPVKVIIKGKTYMTKAMELFVEKGNSIKKSKLSEAFIDVNISKKELYQYEKINVTYNLYIKEGYTISNLNLINKVKLNDFFIHTKYDIFTVNPSSIGFSMININGVNYKEIKILSYDMAPKKTGKISIPIISIQGMVGKNETNFFNDPWGMTPRNFISKRVVLTSPQKNIRVKPLPVNKYKSFSGIVTSNLKIESMVSSKKTKTGEGVTYIIVLKGNFLYEIITPPKLKGGNMFEVYEPEVKTSLDYIQYKYFIVPKLEGDFKLPIPEIIYFNTKRKKFEKISPSAKYISVSRGENSTYSSSGIRNKNNLKYSSRDIYYLKPANEITLVFGLIVYEWWYILLFIISLFMPVIKITNSLKTKKYKENIVYRKKIKASKMAKKWKKQVRKYEGKEFYSFAYNFLFNYLTNKFYEISEDTTIEGLIKHLKHKIKNKGKIEEIKDLFSEIETLRFSPSGKNKRENLIKRIADIIDYFE